VIYQGYVALMNQHGPFFRNLWHHPHLQEYRTRWTALVAESILVRFSRVMPQVVDQAWALHHRFAAGVIATYLEEAMVGEGRSLRDLTFYCLEFLHGGYLRFYQITRTDHPSADPGFDETLARYALYVDGLDARPPSPHPRRRASDWPQEPPVEVVRPRKLGVEGGRHQGPLADQHRVAPVPGQHLDPRAQGRDPGSPDEHPRHEA